MGIRAESKSATADMRASIEKDRSNEDKNLPLISAIFSGTTSIHPCTYLNERFLISIYQYLIKLIVFIFNPDSQ